MTWDHVAQRLIVFDNFDDEFWAFARNGQAEVIGTSSGASFYSLTTLADGRLAMTIDGSLVTIDPTQGQQTPYLDIRGPIGYEAFEFAGRPANTHTVDVGVREVVTGVDAGEHDEHGEEAQRQLGGRQFSDLTSDES